MKYYTLTALFKLLDAAFGFIIGLSQQLFVANTHTPQFSWQIQVKQENQFMHIERTGLRCYRCTTYVIVVTNFIQPQTRLKLPWV